MINDQIYLWILKNKHIYFSQSLYQTLQKMFIYNFDVEFKSSMKIILTQFIKQTKLALIDGKAVKLQQFVLFWREQSSSKEGDMFKLKYRFCENIQIIANIATHKQFINKESVYEQSIVIKISNNLNIPQHIIQELLSIFVKSIYNLIHLGRQLSISLQFCKLTLSNKKLACIFSRPFIKQLNDLHNSKHTQNKQNYSLSVCISDNCNKPIYNYTKHRENMLKQDWQRIKQRNLLDKTSLIDLQQHFNKGRDLLLQYKRQFQ